MNFFTLPPTSAAKAYAASFALWMSAAARRSLTLSRSPACRLIVDSPTDGAGPSTRTVSSLFVFSIVSSAVMSFVRLAIGSRRSGFSA